MSNNVRHTLAIDVQPELVGARRRTISKQDAALEHGRDMLPLTDSNYILRFERQAAIGVALSFNMEKQSKCIRAALFQGEIIRVAAVAGIAPEKDLLDDILFISHGEEIQDVAIGLRNRPHPAFDGEGIGESQIGRVA